jgi:phage shock protein A
MGFFQRLANLWSGFLSLFVSDLESKNPEAVYEAAINERVKKHKELKKAVSNIIYLRNKLSDELESKERELRDITAQIPVAVEEGEDEVALVLLQKQEELQTAIAALSEDLTKVEGQADEAKSGLMSFQAEIEKLRREKEQMLAQKTNAEARISIQESLSGLSTDADIQALDNVRASIHKLKAEADVGAEVGESSLDAKLKRIKEKTGSATARARLDEMKRQIAAREAGAAAEGVKKTM